MRPHCRGTIHYGCRVFDGEEDITTALAVSTTSAPVVVTLGDTVAVVAFPVDANAVASLHVAENGAQVRSHLRGTTTICFPPNVPRRTRYTSTYLIPKTPSPSELALVSLFNTKMHNPRLCILLATTGH